MNETMCALTRRKDQPLTHEVVFLIGDKALPRKVSLMGFYMLEMWLATRGNVDEDGPLKEIVFLPDNFLQPFEDVIKYRAIGEEEWHVSWDGEAGDWTGVEDDMRSRMDTESVEAEIELEAGEELRAYKFGQETQQDNEQ